MEQMTRRGLRNNLEIEGYDVDLAATGGEALKVVRRRSPGKVRESGHAARAYS
jgi:DNA-binding response OmpR family regulator